MWGAGGLLGGRLTADLVLRSPQGMNCLGDYELCLRGARAERRPPPLTIEMHHQNAFTKPKFNQISLKSTKSVISHRKIFV